MELNLSTSRNWSEAFGLTFERGKELSERGIHIYQSYIRQTIQKWTTVNGGEPPKAGLMDCANQILALAENEKEEFFLAFKVGQYHGESEEIVQKTVLEFMVAKILS